VPHRGDTGGSALGDTESLRILGDELGTSVGCMLERHCWEGTGTTGSGTRCALISTRSSTRGYALHWGDAAGTSLATPLPSVFDVLGRSWEA
jgi:hypothetical protein